MGWPLTWSVAVLMIGDSQKVAHVQGNQFDPGNPGLGDYLEVNMGIRKIPYGIKGREKAVRVIHKLQGQQVVHFLHIGKTGGTAVKYALKRNLVNKEYMIYLHGHEFKLRDVQKGAKAFFFLRDPVDRFVSGFYSRRRQGQPRIFSPWSQARRSRI